MQVWGRGKFPAHLRQILIRLCEKIITRAPGPMRAWCTALEFEGHVVIDKSILRDDIGDKDLNGLKSSGRVKGLLVLITYKQWMHTCAACKSDSKCPGNEIQISQCESAWVSQFHYPLVRHIGEERTVKSISETGHKWRDLRKDVKFFIQ